MRQSLSNLIHSYMIELIDDYKQSLNWPSAEDVVSALRNGLPLEETYELLRHFGSTQRHNPIITTDRGKVLYVEYQEQTRRVVLYIGDQSDFVKVYKGPDRQLYVLALEERYEFYPAQNDVIVARKHIDRNGLIECTLEEPRRSGRYVPALYFFVFSNPRQGSECSVRTEWMPAHAACEAPPQAHAAGSPGSAPPRCDAQERPSNGADAAVPPSSNDPRHSASKLRPVIDPRVSSLVNKTFRPRGVLSA